MRVRPMSSRARCRLSGGSASALSSSTSTAVPPAPNRMTGPNSGSSTAPTMSSWAPGPPAMGCTVKPETRASGLSSDTRARISSAASRTASGVARSRRTPPTSDLCVMSGDRILSATGPPSASAARAASSGVAAPRLSMTGMP